MQYDGTKFKVKFANGSVFDFNLRKYNDYNYEVVRTSYGSAGTISKDDVNDNAILDVCTKWSDSSKAVQVIW